MNQQHCPKVNDFVLKQKCNACNLELVQREKVCCKYISCIHTCDWKDKESCQTYRQEMNALILKKAQKPGKN